MLRAWLRSGCAALAFLLIFLASSIGASAGNGLADPPRPASSSASKTPSITIDQAVDILFALPEIKTWTSYVERVSNGKLHGKLLVESDKPIVVKGRKYWSVSFI